MRKNTTLLNKKFPIVINPRLAKYIGLNEAIILQQLEYWLEKNEEEGRNFYDGHYWSFNTYDRWQDQFPWWSKDTIKRTFKKLEKNNLIITRNYNKKNFDKTKWYTINYKKLEELENYYEYTENKKNFTSMQNAQTNKTNYTDEQGNLHKPIPETTTEEGNQSGERSQSPSNDAVDKVQNYSPLIQQNKGYTEDETTEEHNRQINWENIPF